MGVQRTQTVNTITQTHTGTDIQTYRQTDTHTHTDVDVDTGQRQTERAVRFICPPLTPPPPDPQPVMCSCSVEVDTRATGVVAGEIKGGDDRIAIAGAWNESIDIVQGDTRKVLLQYGVEGEEREGRGKEKGEKEFSRQNDQMGGKEGGEKNR